MSSRVVHEDPVEQHGFTQIANVVLEDNTLSMGARFVYIMLKRYAWQNQKCFPGQDTLAETLGVTSKTVRAWLNELVEVGLVTKQRRGQGQTNLYLITSLTGQYHRSGISERSLTTVLEPPLATEEEDSVQEERTSPSSLVSDGAPPVASRQPPVTAKRPSPTLKTRARDPIWETVVRVSGLAGNLPPSEASDVGKTVKEMKANGARVEEIEAAREAWDSLFEGATFTHRCLRLHWAALMGEAERARNRGEESPYVERNGATMFKWEAERFDRIQAEHPEWDWGQVLAEDQRNTEAGSG